MDEIREYVNSAFTSSVEELEKMDNKIEDLLADIKSDAESKSDSYCFARNMQSKLITLAELQARRSEIENKFLCLSSILVEIDCRNSLS